MAAPSFEEYKELNKSPIADLKNTAVEVQERLLLVCYWRIRSKQALAALGYSRYSLY